MFDRTASSALTAVPSALWRTLLRFPLVLADLLRMALTAGAAVVIVSGSAGWLIARLQSYVWTGTGTANGLQAYGALLEFIDREAPGFLRLLIVGAIVWFVVALWLEALMGRVAVARLAPGGDERPLLAVVAVRGLRWITTAAWIGILATTLGPRSGDSWAAWLAALMLAGLVAVGSAVVEAIWRSGCRLRGPALEAACGSLFLLISLHWATLALVVLVARIAALLPPAPAAGVVLMLAAAGVILQSHMVLSRYSCVDIIRRDVGE